MLLMSRIVRHIEQSSGDAMDNGPAPYGYPGAGGITDPMHPHQPHAATHGLISRNPLQAPGGFPGVPSPNRRAAGAMPQGLLPHFPM